MFLKKYKPINNSLRNKNILILKNRIKFKRLFIRLKKKNGKNYSGRTTIKYNGGGTFKLYRVIDNLFYKYNYNYKSVGFDKSYFSTALISLVKSDLNTYKYIIIPNNFNIGDCTKVTFFFKNELDNLSNVLPLGWIPNNTMIYNLESKPFSGSKFIKAAGTFGKVLSHTKDFVKVILPSKKKKYFSKYCLASIGRVSNLFHKFQNYGKAGYSRLNNIRPRVSGCKMNSVDHPNGGKTKRGKPVKNFSGKIIK